MNGFKCKNCGECCSNFLPLLKEEIQTMKRLAKKENIHKFRQDWYTQCPFLNNERKCDIYEERPFICREFTCYNYKNGTGNMDNFRQYEHSDFKLTDIRKEIFKRTEI